MEKHNTIFEFVTAQEASMLMAATVIDNWEWSFREHVRLSVLYKNGQFDTGRNDNKPFKNIIRPILNLQYRAEGFDVKDIIFYVDDSEQYHKSFLVKKKHERWARENGIDAFIDDVVETYIDFGGVLVKKLAGVKPEIVPFQSIAFCDQTDILGGPIGIKHFLSPDQFREMGKRGWGKEENGATATIDDVVMLAQNQKVPDKTYGKQNQTPGKYVEVYEIHGTLPQKFLDDGDSEEYITQMQIVAFYYDKEGKRNGLILFRKKVTNEIFKFLARDKVYGRALGYGGAEELFEAQVWTNYGMIKKKHILDGAGILFQTSDAAYANRNKVKDMDNMEITVVEDGKRIEQINTTPVNIALFDNAVRDWEDYAKFAASANESIFGQSPSAGTPFKLQELVTAESHSLHEYRKGKLAIFVEEIYRDWLIPHFAKEITKGEKFLAELDADELQFIARTIAQNKVNFFIKETILNGEIPNEENIALMQQELQQEFLKKGNKKFIEIVENELKDVALGIKINIVGKQKYLSQMTDKIVNMIRQAIATPQIWNDPRFVKILNQVLEYSGLSPIEFDFTGPPQPAQSGSTQPLREFTPKPQQIKELALT